MNSQPIKIKYLMVPICPVFFSFVTENSNVDLMCRCSIEKRKRGKNVFILGKALRKTEFKVQVQ